MRAKIAMVLVRLAMRILTGHDDRVVILNTPRKRALPHCSDAGRVRAFIGPANDPRAAYAMATDDPDLEVFGFGTPVPVWVAKMAGYRVVGI